METQRLLIQSDIISNLPDNVIQSILVKLPIRDAVQTSLLSPTWRDKWTTIPDLCFSTPPSSEAQGETHRMYKLSSFIDRVLLLHKGPIHKFELFMPRGNPSVINSWINFLSRNGVKKLKLSFDFKNLCTTPSSVFSCEALSSLELFGCVIHPPTMFSGFSNLKSLLLDHVSLVDEELDSMISHCTVLEILKLIVIHGCSYFNIRGRNLKYFYLRSQFEGICFEDIPNLSCVCIILINGILDVGVETSNLIEVLGCLPGLQRLYVEGYSLEFFAMSSVPERLPFTLDRLRSISLGINFEDLNETSVILCLVKSSPNLQDLKIMVYSNVKVPIQWPKDYWEAQDSLACSMNQLRVVKMIGIFGVRPELEFIKLLLANSPVLEILSITPKWGECVKKYRMLKELVRFRRASTKAEIEYKSSRGFNYSRPIWFNELH